MARKVVRMEPPHLRHGEGGLRAAMPKEYSPASLKATTPKGYFTVAGAGAWVDNGKDVHAMTKMRWRDPDLQKSK